MTKILVMIGFTVCLGLAIYAYLTKSKPLQMEQIAKKGGSAPRASLDEFTYYRFDEATLASRLAAKRGEILEPNRIELRGDVKGWRFRENREESLVCQNATGFFQSNSAVDLINKMDIKKVELEDAVSMGVSNHKLFTDYAEYLADEKVIVSDRPVRVEGPKRWFTGDHGFKYETVTETVHIFGPVRGVVVPENEGPFQ